MYKVITPAKVEKKISSFPKPVQKRIVLSLYHLSLDPFPQGYKKLVNRNGYRIRVGDYRIVYEVYKTQIVIEIIDIDHRKDVYQ